LTIALSSELQGFVGWYYNVDRIQYCNEWPAIYKGWEVCIGHR